jgi:hypothetical protein
MVGCCRAAGSMRRPDPLPRWRRHAHVGTADGAARHQPAWSSAHTACTAAPIHSSARVRMRPMLQSGPGRRVVQQCRRWAGRSIEATTPCETPARMGRGMLRAAHHPGMQQVGWLGRGRHHHARRLLHLAVQDQPTSQLTCCWCVGRVRSGSAHTLPSDIAASACLDHHT